MPSTRSTEPDIDSPKSEANLGLSARMSLRQRILAVNIIAVLLLAGSFFYLDSYRKRLVDERIKSVTIEAEIVLAALPRIAAADHVTFLAGVSRKTGTRFRLADEGGNIVADGWQPGVPQFGLRDPSFEPWQRDVARWLDDIIETIADRTDPKLFEGFTPPARWPINASGWSLAPDRTHIVWSTRQTSGETPFHLMAEANARDIRRLVRAERERLAWIIAAVSLISVLLSLFLARTIERPLRALAVAALRVRHGRDREVVVPRLPARRDEIGLLARALSDMTHALRQRIDATEAFAADVAHELKNPLASLSSAAQSLRSVKKADLRRQLEDVIASDVVRLDRLITDISELSRLDARLARTRFESVDLGKIIAGIVANRVARGIGGEVAVAFARPLDNTAIVSGDASQLSRVIENLLSNAISFSPENGLVRIAATRDDGSVQISIEDEGPGIPEHVREAVFERFHSDRPDSEAFGQHSGLGLSIARTIIEGHGGSITASDRGSGLSGARLIVRLPALGLEQ
jgi:two-component system, OmpR family, sensor histidine kinase ChvG